MRLLNVILFVALGCSLVTCEHQRTYPRRYPTNKKYPSVHIYGITANEDASEYYDDVGEYDDTDSTTKTISLADAPELITNTAKKFGSDIEKFGEHFLQGVQNISDVINDPDHQSHNAADAIAHETFAVANNVIDEAIKTVDNVKFDAKKIVTASVRDYKDGITDGVKYVVGDSLKGDIEDGFVDIGDGLANATTTFIGGSMDVIDDMAQTATDTLKSGEPILRGAIKVVNGTVEKLKPIATDAAVFVEIGAKKIADDVNNAAKVVDAETENVVKRTDSFLNIFRIIG